MLFLSVSDTFEKKSDSPGLFYIVFHSRLTSKSLANNWAGRFFGRALLLLGRA